tara:strand:+ start:181 stop:417 length:237 start_codon:yes stop_codon:yes gene_type:complete
MKFELNYGKVKTFEAPDETGVVDFLRKGHLFPMKDRESFLKQAAQTASSWSGESIRFDSPISFAKDLMKVGILRRVSP